MTWLDTLAELARDGSEVVVVTIVQVRGHAPRDAGAKMLVTADALRGSIGGGDLELSAVIRAREMIAQGTAGPELLLRTLNPSGGEHGVQCCGGEVTLLLEPLHNRRPSVAIFGAGHVGKALLRVLAPLPLTLFLIDSRAAEIGSASPPDDAGADITLRHAPVPESALEDLPPGSFLLVLTHDHAEDLAVLDMALRRDDLPFIGLIGSSAKWAHFRARLLEAGHHESALARVTTPIGLPGVPGKRPAAIAIAVAAQLLTLLDLPAGDL